MSERGETDSCSIGSSDKFRATAVRRSVFNPQTRRMMAQRRQMDMFRKERIVGMLESSRSQTEVSRILNVDQSVIKTVAEVLKNRRCYPTTRIRSTKSHNPSPRPISGNKCATSEGQYCQSTGFGAHSRQRNMNFKTNCLQETQSYWPMCQKTSSLHSPHVCT
ncbi:transposable element Tc3 transposase [Trichonephila clavipes]|nr:transposable element Tc3 transposase [Trichonephila clavipes]